MNLLIGKGDLASAKRSVTVKFFSDGFLFRDHKDGEKADQCKQGSKEPFPSRGDLRREQLGQGTENEAEYDEICCGGVLFHGAFDQTCGQKDAAHRTDHERSEGQKCHDVKRIDRRGQFFVDTQNKEHLRNANAGQDESNGDDDTAEKLDEDSSDHGKRACSLNLKNAFGDQADQQCANNADDGVNEDGNTDLFDLRRTENHGGTARHRTKEEIACRDGEMCQREGDQLGEKEKSERGADQKFGKEDQAFLEFAFLEDPVDRGDEAVINAEDHCH